MKKQLLYFFFCTFALSAQCRNNSIGRATLISDEIEQCKTVIFGVGIYEGMIGQTHRGNIEIIHKKDETIIEVCYFKDDNAHPAMPNFFHDEIEVVFEDSGSKEVLVKVKNTLETNQKDCSICNEFVIDTFTINVTPRNKLAFFPNPTFDFVEIKKKDTPEKERNDLNLYTTNGTLIQKVQLYNNNTKLNLSNYPSGVFFLKEKDSESCTGQVYKLVKN